MASATDAEHDKIALEQRRGERRAEAARNSGYDRCMHHLLSSFAADESCGRQKRRSSVKRPGHRLRL